VATDDLVFLLDGLGIAHGVDPARLKAASDLLAGHLDHPLPSRVFAAPPLVHLPASSPNRART
jgi:hydroxymethylglutaryl-CoA lyase